MRDTTCTKTIISLRGISKTYSETVLFRHVSLTVNDGDKIGIVGHNGSGKSTLLRILAGMEAVDEGDRFVKKNVRIHYIPQELPEKNKSLGEARKQVIFPIFSQEKDVLLLDEPTNGLDALGVDALQKTLSRYRGAYCVVSHDRAFLEENVTVIWEVDTTTKRIRIYEGSYSHYKEEKDAMLEKEKAREARELKQEKKMKQEYVARVGYIEKIEGVRRGIRHLPQREKEKPVRAVLRDREGKAGRRARVLKDRITRTQNVFTKRAVPEKQFDFTFDTTRGSTNVFSLHGAYTRRKKTAVGPFTIDVRYGDRIHVAGKNGAGKTSLLLLLAGLGPLLGGELRIGSSVRIGYLITELQEVRSHETALSYAHTYTEATKEAVLKTFASVGIAPEEGRKRVSMLSPGIRSRLMIAKLLLLKPNCIILDEPSNYLDLPSLMALTRALKSYTGTLIIASHDAVFVEEAGLIRKVELPMVW